MREQQTYYPSALHEHYGSVERIRHLIPETSEHAGVLFDASYIGKTFDARAIIRQASAKITDAVASTIGYSEFAQSDKLHRTGPSRSLRNAMHVTAAAELNRYDRPDYVNPSGLDLEKLSNDANSMAHIVIVEKMCKNVVSSAVDNQILIPDPKPGHTRIVGAYDTFSDQNRAFRELSGPITIDTLNSEYRFMSNFLNGPYAKILKPNTKDSTYQASMFAHGTAALFLMSAYIVDHAFKQEQKNQLRATISVPESALQLPPTYQELLNRIDTITSSHTIISPQKLSKTEIKKQGLDSVFTDLVRGAGVQKDMAKQHISTIEHIVNLNAATGNLSATQQQNARDMVQNESVQSKLDAILREARAHLGNGALNAVLEHTPNAGELFQNLDSLRRDWKDVSAIVANQWPDGIRIAENVRTILFDAVPEPHQSAEPAETEEYTEPSSTPIAELAGIAKTLDQIILPARANVSELKEAVAAISENEAASCTEIDWKRLHDLLQLRNNYDGTLYRSRGGDLGGAPPYYVVELLFEGNRYAIAECPVEGNATYIVSENLSPGTWQEVFEFSKFEARELGAARVIHRGKNAQARHLRKIENKLIELMTIEELDA